MAKLAVPQTAAELQEMMDDPKVASQIVLNGQWTEFTTAYAKATDERGEMSEMVTDAVKAAMAGRGEITAQVENTVRDTLATVLQEQGVNRPNMGSGAQAVAGYNPLAPGVALDEVGFTNLGDYARTVFGKGRSDDERLPAVQKVMNAYSSTDPASAGTLIPEEQRAEIMGLALEDAIVRPRATVISMTGGTLSLPYVDETTHSGSFFGGMTFSWTAESVAVTASEAKFGRVKLDPLKLTGGARVPNELWNDASALNSWLMRAIPEGINFSEDTAFLTGTGAMEPLGVHNSPALVSVTKETGQAASTIVTENILKMYARMLPQALGRSVWVANPTTFPQLMALSLSVGTGGSNVNLVDVTATQTLALLGRPLILSEKVPTLGTVGDIGLYDFGFYLVGDRQQVALESSEHSRFMNDETELRAILRVDGRPWIQSALTPANGDTLSPFVVTATRA